MTTPSKSELDEARERLELRERSARLCSWAVCYVNNDDLRLVLDALKEAERAVKDQEPIVSAVVDWSHTGVRGFEWNAANAFLADLTIKANELVTKWTSTPIDIQEPQ